MQPTVCSKGDSGLWTSGRHGAGGPGPNGVWAACHDTRVNHGAAAVPASPSPARAAPASAMMRAASSANTSVE